MKKPVRITQKIFGALLMFLVSTAVHAQNKVVAYVPNWINLNTYVNQIQYSKLTHINIAFENLYNDNGDLSFNTADNVLIQRAHANNIKVCVSIGGGSASGDQVLTNRYFTQISASRRAAFVDKISAYITAHNFDGIDVDLEGPSINGDYGAFIQALSNKLKPQGKLVTAALSQGYGGGNVPSSVFQYLDFMNIMAYDGKGYWNPNDPGNHSTLDFAKSNTQYWINRGLPRAKAILGVPFYGYGFGAAFRNRDYPYNEVVNNYPGAENVDQVGSTIWYNGIPTIKAKTNYAFDMGIGGIMIWSLDYDGTGAKSLLSAIDQVFDARSVDNPPIPQAPYNNVRANIPGKIEVENYDVGGQDVAYNDLTVGNEGAIYRTDGVDVQATTDAGGGYNVGWTTDGEWLEYSVNVTTAGSYDVVFRTAGTAAGAIRMELDGVDISGTVALPNTTGWQIWANTTKSNVSFTAGNHILRLFVVTGGFNINSVTVSTPINTPPVVNITAPAVNTSYTAPATIAIAANASDANGTVAKVEFFNGASKLGEDLTAPYTFSWTNVAVGTYSITARATDNNNAATTSSVVPVSVTSPINTPPTVNITAPVINASFTAPATIAISANATDADGAISKVEFFNGATKLGEDLTAPYSFSWTNVSAGAYSLTARATDNNNAATSSSAVPVTVTTPNNCPNLTWADEFNGNTLDMSKWNYQTGDGCPSLCGWGNNELEYYTNSTNNVSVSGGNLALTARYQPNYNGTGKNYTSGKLVTLGKFSQKYGRFEARIKVPSAAGVWPAFWMLADNTAWPGTGEIDILECANANPTNWLGTLHYGTPSGGYQHRGVNWVAPTPLSNDFHLYAAEWTTSEIRWYVDGVFRGSVTKAALIAGGGSWPFDAQKFYIILNVAVGGNFAGQAPVASQYPVSMLVDYVRAYSGDPCTVPQAPYTGTPIALPGKFEAENYDVGGQGVAYNDISSTNEGGAYRTDGVDVQATTDAGAGYNVGYTAAGEWLEYTVNVATAGNYDIAFRTAGTAPSALRMEIDGADVTGTIALPNTTGWQTWATTTKTNVALPAGQHILRLFVVTEGFNLNNVTVTPVPVLNQSPFGGVAVSLPGKFEAENYDLGGQGIAYNDLTTTNDGGAYRTDAVDVQATTDAGGGHNVGYMSDGEWLEYSVNVVTAGNYNVSFRTASTGVGVVRLEVDGADVTGAVTLPNTAAWQTWATTTKTNVAFTAGAHIVRVFVVTGGFNLNYVTVLAPAVGGPGFLRASGKNIVNNSGNFQIKAINLGNHMVQEGYMLNLGGGYQWNIKNKIADVVGVANRDKFYQDYLANYTTKGDIDSIAKWGFNSVRLPMHYNLFTPLGQQDVYLESGFVMVDNILSWCKANNLYLILDLHAAPGGQSSGDISDYVAGQPSLWESEANRQQTVKLWRKFAERYANEEYIGGYDLINETNWTLANENALLAQLMKEITTTIRQVDNNHIVFIEGNSYANDYRGLTPKWDNNMVYSFHKYWNDNTDASLNFIFNIRDGQNVPIWLGEFGENSNHWIAESITLMNRHNIGWAIWPYKKMASISGTSSFKEPANWGSLAGYINGGAKPTAAAGQAILNELIENIKVQNCTVNYGYLRAMLQQPGNNTTAPFAPVNLPGKITAAHYDQGKQGFAYSDAVFQTAQFGAAGGSHTPWNTGWYYRNDGVDLQYSVSENGPIVGYTETNEWMNYTVNINASGSYAVVARVAGNGGRISLSIDGAMQLTNIAVPATGGWDAYQNVSLGNMNLTYGKHTIRVTIAGAGYNVSSLTFTTSVPVNIPPSISLTSPANNATTLAPANFTIGATAADVDGTVTKVEFFNGATKLGEDVTTPYAFLWSNVAAGNYTITARATDNLGAVATSQVVNVTVTTTVPVNQAPTVSLTSPANNAQYNAPASISIAANASDVDGTVSKVEFFNGATKLGEDASAPYTFTWSNVAAGTYSITARATDNLNATTASAAVSVTVNTVITNPCSGIANYTENNGYVAGSVVQSGGNRYQCKPYPYSGWCNGAAWAYAPGSGAYWSDAWTLTGSCSNARSADATESASVDEAMISNAPNPFNGITKVNLMVKESGNVSVKIYDLTGMEIATVTEGYMEAGEHTIEYNATSLKSNVYLMKYISESGTVIRKIMKTE